MRKYYPNPTFLTKAAKIKQKRHTKLLIFLVILVLLVLLICFVLWGAGKQMEYKENYPNLVGAATSEPTTIHIPGRTSRTHEETEETTTTVPETTETTMLPALPEMTEPEETTTLPTLETQETTQNNAPDVWNNAEPVYFNNTHPLQAITHEERDMRLDVLKQNIIDYAANNPGERISVSYINLGCEETMWVNAMTPIIPSGAFALPMEIVYYQRCDMGVTYPYASMVYYDNGQNTHSSYIASTYSSGKQFYLRTLANYAIAKNDSIALDYLINNIGGVDKSWESIREISGYINYTQPTSYVDYRNIQQRGPYRSSTYDLSKYAEYLYYGFINTPDVYKDLISDMYYSEVPTAFANSFPDSLIFHASGRNEIMHAYTDVAIIDGQEPIVLAISCECSSYNRSLEIMNDLSGLIATYISSCH